MAAAITKKDEELQRMQDDFKRKTAELRAESKAFKPRFIQIDDDSREIGGTVFL